VDFFELRALLDFMRLDGHSYLQSVLLFMIWWTARGIKKDLSDYKFVTDTKLEFHEKKLNDHETRMVRLETKNI